MYKADRSFISITASLFYFIFLVYNILMLKDTTDYHHYESFFTQFKKKGIKFNEMMPETLKRKDLFHFICRSADFVPLAIKSWTAKCIWHLILGVIDLNI